MPDSYGYPTDEEKERLRTFTGTVREYMAYLKSIGNYWPDHDSWGWHEKDVIYKGGERVYEISTGGWSGNEELIDIISEDMVYILYWEKHTRGGHYEFRIPFSQLDSPVLHLKENVDASA